MLYLEIYCTDGTGWRIAVPAEDVRNVRHRTDITNLPDIVINHTCDLLPTFALVSDDFGGKPDTPVPASGFVTLLTGTFATGNRRLTRGDHLRLHDISIDVR